jgi:hypothetical protein
VFGHEKEEANGDEITSSAENVEGVLGSECKGADDAPHIQPVATPDSEKASPEATSGQDSGEEHFGDDDPVLRDIPWHVRRIVSFHDDPTEQTLTFRYFVLTILFLIPGAFLSQLSSYRTTYAPYSVFFVQIASNYVGAWLAKILPAKKIRVPFTRHGFNFNPGPWNSKEHVLVTISCASGATYNLAYGQVKYLLLVQLSLCFVSISVRVRILSKLRLTWNLTYRPISVSELYLGITIHPAVAIFFMWSVVYTGYAFASIARQFLLYDPQYPW